MPPDVDLFCKGVSPEKESLCSFITPRGFVMLLFTANSIF